MSEYLYLDYAASSPLRLEAWEAMLPYVRAEGNPSSIHRRGREALAALEEARRRVAAALGADPEEIVFTSGGTESDNLALRGVALAASSPGAPRHILTSAVEHEAVLETCAQLRDRSGCTCTLVPVDGEGRVDPDAVSDALTERTVLVSVMYANNEVGTVQPVREIARRAHARGIPFHTDAVQAAGALPLDVRTLDCDLLSLSAHKFGGPRGVGVLYVRRGTTLSPQITGGGQEGGRRSGTENVAGAMGAAVALELAQAEQVETSARLTHWRDRLLEEIAMRVPGAVVTGPRTERLPGHASFAIPGTESSILLLALDKEGIGASAGSACAVGRGNISHVLTAMGTDPALGAGALRLSLGAGTTEAGVNRVLETLPRVVARVREMLGYASSSDVRTAL